MNESNPESIGTTDEIACWDLWNRSHRTAAFVEDSDAARTGRMGLAELLALNLEKPRILEVGCGTGWLADQLAGRGNYVGLDLSPEAIAVARERVPEGQFVAADYHTWENDGEPFDVILMIDTIAYFRDQQEALRRTRSLLKTGGMFILTTVNPFVYSRMSWIGSPAKGQVRKWLSKRNLHTLLTTAGLAVRKSRTAFPAGDRGILRIVNSRVLNGLLGIFGLKDWARTAKERIGLGQYRLVVAEAISTKDEDRKG